MKIKLSYPKPNIQTNRKCTNSVEKIKPKKKINTSLNPQPPIISLKSAVLQNNHPRYIAIVSLPTEPKKKKAMKLPVQSPQFVKEFEEITNIYKKSQQKKKQEEEIDMFCLDETLEDNYKPRIKSKSYASISNRYSEKSGTLLPSIAEKDQQQDREDELMMVTVVKPSKRSPMSTDTNNRTKNIRSANDHYINDFDIKIRSTSKQKKMTIDVQHVIKSRSKTKSSMSHKASRPSKRK